MEHLINIVIVFIIIASILKRLREVGETRGNLGKPAPPDQRPVVSHIPSSAPPQEKQPIPADQMRPPVMSMEQTQPVSEVPFDSEMMEPEFWPVERLPEIPTLRPEYNTALSEETWERAEQEIEERIRESQEAYRNSLDQQASDVKEHIPMQPTGAIGLRFTGDAVVNGIIMSEILGPPKSLREEKW